MNIGGVAAPTPLAKHAQTRHSTPHTSERSATPPRHRPTASSSWHSVPWGLRSGEVAALHRSQLVLNPSEAEVPYVDFEGRKNGPGQVSFLYGQTAATDRLAELDERDHWTGYLFPSKRAAADHRPRQTILSWFDALAASADLPAEIDGQKPIPQMA